MPIYKDIKEKLKSRKHSTLPTRYWRLSKQPRPEAIKGKDEPVYPNWSTPTVRVIHDRHSFDWMNNPQSSMPSSTEGTLRLSRDTSSNQGTLVCTGVGDGQHQSLSHSISTISAPLSESQTLTRTAAGGYPPFEDMVPSGEVATSWEDRSSTSGWSSWWSDEPENNAEVHNTSSEGKGVRSAIRVYWVQKHFSLNPFRRRPVHTKPALVRFEID